MKGLTFDVSIPRFVLAKTVGRYTNTAVFGTLSGLRLRDLPAPELPRPDWVRLKVLLCGVCGTDVGNLTFSSSPAMEPFGSFPAVLGHEILAEVVEVGSGVTRFRPGQRVAVDPMLSCTVRGYSAPDTCPSCAAGSHSTCERGGEDGTVEIGGRTLAPGMTVGYHRDLPGGWGEEMIAHETQLFPIPDELDDGTAVLVEPLSIGMHAVLGSGVHASKPGSVFVIGSGPIALATIWALRATGYEGYILSQAKRTHEAELALAFGASDVVAPGLEAREALIGTGASAYMPIVGTEVYAGGGFPLIFDCVGSAVTIDQSIRFAAPRGRVVMLGCAAQLKKLDLTFLWARELDIKGFVGYGEEVWRGKACHTFEVTLELLRETGGEPGVDLGRMVTHRFPLSEYRTALAAARNHRRSGAVKVVLEP